MAISSHLVKVKSLGEMAQAGKKKLVGSKLGKESARKPRLFNMLTLVFKQDKVFPRRTSPKAPGIAIAA